MMYSGTFECRRCGGLPTEATVAQVLVSKYADHLPLYRQAQIYARQGVSHVGEASQRAAVQDPSPVHACVGTDVDDPVRVPHDVELVLNHEERVAG